MKTLDLPVDQFMLHPGSKAKLADYDTAWMGTDDIRALGEAKLKRNAKLYLKARKKELAQAQELLYACDRYSLLIVFQAMDAAGKDGTIKHVMSGVNPQGCQVFSFKEPSAEELDHNYLWRCWKVLPERGRIGIFNRSYYEEVLVTRVHPEILEGEKIPRDKLDRAVWRERFEDINAFERHMIRNGTVILKFFLHISKDEQKRRFLKRLDEADKHWKFSENDLSSRDYWDQYQSAYEEALNATSTKWAPWYIIPADHKWIMRALVGHIITRQLMGLNLHFPEPTARKLAAMQRAKEKLLAE